MVRWTKSRGSKTGMSGAAALLATLWALFGGGMGAAIADQGPEAEFVSALNASRGGLGGFAALVRTSDLDQIAARHAAEMAARGAIFHNADLGRQVQNWQALGENVGVGPDVATLHQAFLDSPAHRANILDARYGDVGIGVATTGDGHLWVVEVFRKPVPVASTASPAPTPAPAPATVSAAPAPVRRSTPPPAPTTEVRRQPVIVAIANPTPAPIAAPIIEPKTTSVIEPAAVVMPESALVDLSTEPLRLAVATQPDAPTSPAAALPVETRKPRSVQHAAVLAALLWMAVALSLLRSFQGTPALVPATTRRLVPAIALRSA